MEWQDPGPLPLSHPTIQRECPFLHPPTAPVVMFSDPPPGSPSKASAAYANRQRTLTTLATLPDLSVFIPPPTTRVAAPPPPSAAAVRLGLVPDPRLAKARARKRAAAAAAARAAALDLPRRCDAGLIEFHALDLLPSVAVDAAGEPLVNLDALVIAYSFLDVWIHVAPLSDETPARHVFDFGAGSVGRARLDALVDTDLAAADAAGDPAARIVFSVLDTSLPLDDQEVACAAVSLTDLAAPDGSNYIQESIALTKLRSSFGPAPQCTKLIPAGSLSLTLLLRAPLRAALARSRARAAPSPLQALLAS